MRNRTYPVARCIVFRNDDPLGRPTSSIIQMQKCWIVIVDTEGHKFRLGKREYSKGEGWGSWVENHIMFLPSIAIGWRAYFPFKDGAQAGIGFVGTCERHTVPSFGSGNGSAGTVISQYARLLISFGIAGRICAICHESPHPEVAIFGDWLTSIYDWICLDNHMIPLTNTNED